MMNRSLTELNMQIAKALGVTDTKVTKVVLTLNAGELPEVLVFKPLFIGDEFEAVMEAYKLMPSAENKGRPPFLEEMKDGTFTHAPPRSER